MFKCKHTPSGDKLTRKLEKRESMFRFCGYEFVMIEEDFCRECRCFYQKETQLNARHTEAAIDYGRKQVLDELEAEKQIQQPENNAQWQEVPIKT